MIVPRQAEFRPAASHVVLDSEVRRKGDGWNPPLRCPNGERRTENCERLTLNV
jgi:hypothetical protein